MTSKAELVTTRQLAEQTGYSRNYIVQLVRRGELTPAGKLGNSLAFVGDEINPKPESGRRTALESTVARAPVPQFAICGQCEYHDRTSCLQTERSAAHNSRACRLWIRRETL